jgi:release factor glutamine methyltransferase
MKTADLKTLYKSIESKIAKHYPGISERRFLQQFTNFEIDEKTLTDKLLLGVPLEYITRSSFFYQSEFYVNEDVLIPRCETEILVEKAYHLSHRFKDENKKINVIDVGTGCGAIIASFAKIYEGKPIISQLIFPNQL